MGGYSIELNEGSLRNADVSIFMGHVFSIYPPFHVALLAVKFIRRIPKAK